jgi:hypothetical protein
MAGNYLEQLVSEWYEYKGYFVRRNIQVEKRQKGGHESELDVVAFHPVDKKLAHIEPSMDSFSWAERELRYKRKFELGEKYIPKIFEGMDLPKTDDGKLIIEKVVLLEFASKQNHELIGGGKILLVYELLREIFIEFLPKDKSISTNAVPEHMPTLRTLQFLSSHKEEIFGKRIESVHLFRK